jgi:hypothetical protein
VQHAAVAHVHADMAKKVVDAQQHDVSCPRLVHTFGAYDRPLHVDQVVDDHAVGGALVLLGKRREWNTELLEKHEAHEPPAVHAIALTPTVSER